MSEEDEDEDGRGLELHLILRDPGLRIIDSIFPNSGCQLGAYIG